MASNLAMEETPLTTAAHNNLIQPSDDTTPPVILVTQKSTSNGASSTSSSSPPATTTIAIKLGVPNDTPKVDSAVSGLRATFRSGVTKPLAWRLNALHTLRKCLVETKDEIYDALYHDLRKCAFETWLAEYQFVLNEIDEAIHSLATWMKPTSVNTNLLNIPGSSQLVKDPLGVVLIISPWNYPFQLLIAPLVGALAAGNTCLLKPSELATHLSAWVAKDLKRYMHSCGVDVIEGGVEPTQALLKHQFDLIFYTGGGFVGKIILRAAAEFLTPVILELGGKSPCCILKDANLDLAARRVVWGKLMNAGQTCIAPDYLLVEASIQDEFIKKLQEQVKVMYGENPEQSPDYGRIINENHTKRLRGLVEPLEAGLTPVVGNPNQINVEKQYIPPIFLTGVQSHHRVMADEIFGPILPILTIENGVDDMISFINQRPKPLALYIFTSNDDTATKIVTETSSGGVAVNDCLVHIANATLPFGGVGPSGMGSYHGVKSFEIFSHIKSVLKRPSPSIFDAPQRYPPYSSGKQTFLGLIFSLQNLGLYKPYWYVLSTIIILGVLAILITKFAGKLW